MSASPFWTWSCAVYREDAVRDACLALQDRHEVSVNLALWCVWLAASGRCVDEAGARQAGDIAATMQNAVTGHIRAARRWLKSPHPALDLEAAAALRERLLADELEAERLEQEALAALAMPAPNQAATDEIGAAATATFAAATRQAPSEARAQLAPLTNALAATGALQQA